MDAGTDHQLAETSSGGSEKVENVQGFENGRIQVESKKQSRLKVATVCILCFFNLTYYMDRFGIAGKCVIRFLIEILIGISSGVS
jgi:hypothetical protein